MTAAHVLDVGKTITPIALLKIMQAVEGMNNLDTIEIMGVTEPQITDISILLRHASCHLIGVCETGTVHRLTFIKKIPGSNGTK